MISLARSTLRHEWRRYLAAVMALSFSALLVIVQLGLLLGMFSTVSVVVDKSRADLWVSSLNIPSFDMAREMPARNEVFLRLHPEVEKVQKLDFSMADWRAPDGTKAVAVVIALDTDSDSLSLPVNFTERQRKLLEEPMSVIVDSADIKKLKVRTGDIAELNKKRIKVASVVSGFRNIGGVYIFVSRYTSKLLFGNALDYDRTQFFLLKLRNHRRAVEIKDELNKNSRDKYSVWIPQELSGKSQRYWLFESGAGVGFGFSSLLGLLVGVAITSQTLRGAILASIREYATLRALGVPLGCLRNVVLEQSFWVGLTGLCVSGILTGGILMIANIYQISIKIPIWSVSFTVIFTMLIAMLSGLLALRILYKSEPAELLR